MMYRMSVFFASFIFVVSCASVPEVDSGEPVAEDPMVQRLNRLAGRGHLDRIRAGTLCRMISSHDRTGGNDDGFSGRFSALRLEDGDSVIAEMEGAGCIQRMWFTHSEMEKDGLLGGESEHIRIYLDGSETPVVDVPLEQLFSGELELFPHPLVGELLGGFYSYVPIPYSNGCKIVIEGTHVRYYHVTYTEDDSERTSSFSVTPEHLHTFERIKSVWKSPGDPAFLDVRGEEEFSYELLLEAGDGKEIVLPQGPRRLRAIMLSSENGVIPDARLRIWFDDSKSAAINAPLQHFFLQGLGPDPFQSMYAGMFEGTWYNYLPMPWRRSAVLRIDTAERCEATLRLIVEPVDSDFDGVRRGYLHAQYFEMLPTEGGLHYPILNREGTGQIVGFYLATEGLKGAPVWLEGDERIWVDGELVIHGTGTEDYFNCGWYAVENRLNRAGVHPTHGFPVYGETDDTMQATAYRWHLDDPVPYGDRIDAKLEHGPQNDWDADYRSVVFFYDTDPEAAVIAVEVPTGTQAIDYVGKSLIRWAFTDPSQGLEAIERTASENTDPLVESLLHGAREYLSFVANPDSDPSAALSAHIRHCRHTAETLTDSAGERAADARLAIAILERARHDASRRYSAANGMRPGDEVIVESRDPLSSVTPAPMYSESEDFTHSTAKTDDPRLIGTGTRFTRGAAGSYARFVPAVPTSGRYEVFVAFSFGSNASDTRYLVKHAGGEEMIPLPQRGRLGTPNANGDQWISLGVFPFEQGTDLETGSVTLLAGTTGTRPSDEFEYRAYADAVRLVFMGE